jgi:hypothetical protein
MTKLLISITFIFVPAFFVAGQQQKSRVHTEYLKDTNRTTVAANTLYVFNSPEQFVQLQLRGLIWGKEPLFPAEQLRLEFYSFSQSAIFKKEEDREIEITIDDHKLKLSKAEYQKVGADKARQMLPKSAIVNGNVVMETLFFKVTPEVIGDWIEAKNIEFRLGAINFVLNDNHKSIVREFGTYVLPSADVTPQPGTGVESVVPVLPAELTNASLPTTLNWLRDKLTTSAVTANWGRINHFEAIQFSNCKIEYRIINESVGWGTRIDLSKVNPNSIKAVSYEDRAYVYFRTEGGGFATSITLASAKSAPTITAALKQAVTLCQTTP